MFLNPFSNGVPDSSINFCNREEELKLLIHHSQNNINTILIGIKRIGKTALLHQLINQLQDFTNQKCFYLNIAYTNNFDDFTTKIYSCLLPHFQKLRPESFSIVSNNEQLNQLQNLLEQLDKQKLKIIVAIDEFQETTKYSDRSKLKQLQSVIQKLKNINFIFSVNNETVLSELAGDENQTFFANSDIIQLTNIKLTAYSKFISDLFEKSNKTISKEAIEFILDWTRSHTFYTQTLCKRIFNISSNLIDLEDVHDECGSILEENESSYSNYRNLLSPVQWLLLKAIAKEEKVYHPTAKNFLIQHNIGTPANVQRALDALLYKEMVFANRDEKGRFYQVYDCFLSRWLEGLD